ncbi:Hypothetical predicted protein [Mytilus galloprovincialis]|uniref:Uncharacterized protein n=1 Tax=Mytilus galloprovincialis TaxID=29158 RepID=A0A8B6D4K1_MYTGA|nr:Hypothetical predicted protein [Mytilus galloprovincialis]
MGQKWGMRFNAKKCYLMSVNNKLSHFYKLDNHILQQVQQNLYLRVIILDDLRSKRQTSNKQRSLDSYFKVARQAGNEETGDIDENSVAINPSPNESVIEAEPVLACSVCKNTPLTSSEILLSPIDYSDPVQFNKRSLSDEDLLKLLKTKWIPSSVVG